MASYHEYNISLTTAMTTDRPNTTRVWDVPGLEVQDKDIPPTADVDRTFVMNHKDSKACVGVMYTLEGDKYSHMATVAEYPQLDIKKLEKDFPELFKLTGTLYAFGEE